MEWQQGVRVMLEKSDGLAIATSSRGLFREGPDQHFRIHVQFEDDFDLKGASVVKVVLVIGYETQLPGSLEDLQCYAIDKAHLIGAHTFDSLVTWKGGSRPVHTPLTIPVPGRPRPEKGLWLDDFNTEKGGIAVFVVRGHCLGAEHNPERRRRESTDPPARCRFETADHGRIIPWDWFKALDEPHGEPLIFDFRNRWEDETLTQPGKRRAERELLKTSHELARHLRDKTTTAPTGFKRSRRLAVKEKETLQSSTERSRRSLFQDNRASNITPFGYSDECDQDDEEILEQKPPTRDVKKEIIEIADNDDNIQPIFPSITAPLVIVPAPSPQVSSNHALDDDNEMLKLRLENSRLKQKQRKMKLKRQDPEIDLDEDAELVDMQLEENEIKQMLRKKELK